MKKFKEKVIKDDELITDENDPTTVTRVTEDDHVVDDEEVFNEETIADCTVKYKELDLKQRQRALLDYLQRPEK